MRAEIIELGILCLMTNSLLATFIMEFLALIYKTTPETALGSLKKGLTLLFYAVGYSAMIISFRSSAKQMKSIRQIALFLIYYLPFSVVCIHIYIFILNHSKAENYEAMRSTILICIAFSILTITAVFFYWANIRNQGDNLYLRHRQ